MRVIKLGGSLAGAPVLQEWLRYLARPRLEKTVLVPGGGPFADQVRIAQRHWRFDDETAHSMALLAMQQMALQFQGICPDLAIADRVRLIHERLQNRSAVIWSPYLQELNQAAIPASWAITSDSLSAWLALSLPARRLILVKSAPVPEHDNYRQMSQQNLIDPAFCRFVEKAPFAVKFYHRQELALFQANEYENET